MIEWVRREFHTGVDQFWPASGQVCMRMAKPLSTAGSRSTTSKSDDSANADVLGDSCQLRPVQGETVNADPRPLHGCSYLGHWLAMICGSKHVELLLISAGSRRYVATDGPCYDTCKVHGRLRVDR